MGERASGAEPILMPSLCDSPYLPAPDDLIGGFTSLGLIKRRSR